jgi:hypothetical protein
MLIHKLIRIFTLAVLIAVVAAPMSFNQALCADHSLSASPDPLLIPDKDRKGTVEVKTDKTSDKKITVTVTSSDKTCVVVSKKASGPYGESCTAKTSRTEGEVDIHVKCIKNENCEVTLTFEATNHNDATSQVRCREPEGGYKASYSPHQGLPGTRLPVEFDAAVDLFQGGLTEFSFGPDIDVDSSRVFSPTEATAYVSISEFSEGGDGWVVVTTGAQVDSCGMFSIYLWEDIPTLSEWALIIFALVILGTITYVMIRRRRNIRSVTA